MAIYIKSIENHSSISAWLDTRNKKWGFQRNYCMLDSNSMIWLLGGPKRVIPIHSESDVKWFRCEVNPMRGNSNARWFRCKVIPCENSYVRCFRFKANNIGGHCRLGLAWSVSEVLHRRLCSLSIYHEGADLSRGTRDKVNPILWHITQYHAIQ